MWNNKGNKNSKICQLCSSEMKPLFQHDFYCPKCEPFEPSKKEAKPKRRILAESEPSDVGFNIVDLDDLYIDDEKTDPGN